MMPSQHAEDACERVELDLGDVMPTSLDTLLKHHPGAALFGAVVMGFLLVRAVFNH
jgi:hypothetical protein